MAAVAGPGPAGPGAAASPTPAQGDPPPPVYPTRLPPSARLTFDMRRGAISGTAELGWQVSSGAYHLDLSTRVLGAEVLGLSSRGSLDSAGIGPQRFVDRRRGRDRLAANFDRATGRITYSGNAPVQAWHPGAQDRLSWMLQLPAILEAGPSRFQPGARIDLYVSGARGDADLWTFHVQGREAVPLPGGTVTDALRLTRDPRKPYDTQVEVWLDPARHHLPVRARMTVLPGGDTLDLRLTGLAFP